MSSRVPRAVDVLDKAELTAQGELLTPCSSERKFQSLPALVTLAGKVFRRVSRSGSTAIYQREER